MAAMGQPWGMMDLAIFDPPPLPSSPLCREAISFAKKMSGDFNFALICI